MKNVPPPHLKKLHPTPTGLSSHYVAFLFFQQNFLSSFQCSKYELCCLRLLVLVPLFAGVVAHRQECLSHFPCTASPVGPSAVMHHTPARNTNFLQCKYSFALSILLLLCGKICVNPGPVKFCLINYMSLRNKDPLQHYVPLSKELHVKAKLLFCQGFQELKPG